jgi:hypothetical protein
MTASAPHPTDQAMALHYEGVRDRLRTRAEAAAAMYEAVYNGEGCGEDEFGTFAPALRSILLKAYNALDQEIEELAHDAQGLVDDYQAHADGTYVRLDPSVLL